MGKLAVKQLESLTDDDVGRKLFDGDGLYGRVRKQKSGIVVTFDFRFSLARKTRTTSCGKWPRESLKQIRKNRDAKLELVEAGIDPIERNRAEKLNKQVAAAQEIEQQKTELVRLTAKKAAERTLSDAITQWEKLELSRRKDDGKEAMRAINKDVLPALGGVALVDVKRAMLVDILDGVVERGARVMANHLFSDLRQFFNFAIAREWVDATPLAGLTKDKIGGRQKERDRYLSEEEIIELNQRLPAANLQRSTELAIWIMLSTCCRVGELSKAHWADVDIEGGKWSIPAGNSKNAKDHTISLSDFTKKQFKALHCISGNFNWCYPSRNEEQPISPKSITKQIKDRVRNDSLVNRTKATGALLLTGGPWTPHDLRRTGATMMGELGVMGEVIERCLNHVEQNKLKRIYQRHELKAEQLEAWRLLGDRMAILKAAEGHEDIVAAHISKKA